MRRRLGVVASFALTIAVTISSCGGSTQSGSGNAGGSAADNGKSTEATQATGGSGKFVVEVNGVCRRINAHAAALEADNGSEVTQLAEQVSRYNAVAVEELAKLSVPREMLADWPSVLAGMRAVVTVDAAYATYSKVGKLSAAHATIAEGEREKRQAAEVAKRDGLTDCAKTL